MDLADLARTEIAKFEAARPKPTEDIDVVWVFSGFGTFLRPTIKNQPLWGRWNDQRNISLGVQIVLETTSLRLGVDVKEISREDIQSCGPILVYNGEPEQNEDFNYALQSPYFPIPESHVIVVPGVANERDRPIGNTLDQFISFPREIVRNQLKKAIALVSGAPHFSRILRYNARFQLFPSEIRIRVFPVPSYDFADIFASREIKKVIEYVKKGDLALEPYPRDLGIY